MVDAVGPPSDFVEMDLLPLREPEVLAESACQRSVSASHQHICRCFVRESHQPITPAAFV